MSKRVMEIPEESLVSEELSDISEALTVFERTSILGPLVQHFPGFESVQRGVEERGYGRGCEVTREFGLQVKILD